MLRDSTVTDPRHQFVDDRKRDKEPLARLDSFAKSIACRKIKAGRPERTMDQPFELGSIDVEELVLGHDFDIREQESRIVTRVGNPAEDRLPRNADLMDQLSMLVDVGM